MTIHWLNSAARNGMIPGTVDKQGLNFARMINMTNGEIDVTLQTIKNQYPRGTMTIVDWQPRDANGYTIHDQQAAIQHWIRNHKK